MKKYKTPEINCVAFETQDIMFGFANSAEFNAEHEMGDNQQ